MAECSACGLSDLAEPLLYDGKAKRIFCNDCHDEYEKLNDSISAPSHYKQGSIECIDAIASALTDEEFRGYIKGNLIKYVWREKFKGGDEDLKKIGKYIELYFERRKK